MDIGDFVSEHFRHFNAGELSRCASSLKEFLDGGGRLIVTLPERCQQLKSAGVSALQ